MLRRLIEEFGPDPLVGALDDDLRRARERSPLLARMLATGVEPAHTIFGLVRIGDRTLSPEDRVAALVELLALHEGAGRRLGEQRLLWSGCFSELGQKLTVALAPRVDRLRQLEKKRASLEKLALERKDDELTHRTARLREQLDEALRSLAGFVAGVARDVESVRLLLVEWDRRAEERAGLAGKVRERADAEEKMLSLEREVSELRRAGDAGPDAVPAGGFDEWIRPLEQGLDAAIAADAGLRERGAGLVDRVRRLESEEPLAPPPAAEGRAGDALLAGPLDGKALVNLALSEAAPAAGPARSFDVALQKITTALDESCHVSLGDAALLYRARRQSNPYLWREYLSRFPSGAAAAEARRALERLERESFAHAERAATRHAWWSHVRDFADGALAAKAREAIEKFPVPESPTEQIRALAVEPKEGIFLGDLKPLECELGWGTLRVNEGGTVRVLGQDCPRYVAPHPRARVLYAIPEGCTRLTAVGTRFDAPEAAHGTWNFEVRIDGKTLFSSSALTDQPDGIPIDVSWPKGCARLELRLDDYGDSHYDWAALAYPYLRRD